jgi:predicted transcriptional regulator
MIDELEKRREAAKKEIKLLHAKLNKKNMVTP